MEKTKNRY